jgi:regulator of RNase E activity RraA
MESMRREAYSAVIADVLDGLGRRDRILSSSIRPLWAEAVLFGRARTIRVRDVDTVSPTPYEVEFALVDDLHPGDVVVAECAGHEAALWGELLTTVAQNHQAAGAVIDGFCRDVKKVQATGFPVFARGTSPADSKGRCEAVARDEPIRCGGVSVFPGDLVFGDFDGVVVIPEELSEEAMRKALEKVRGERTVHRALRSGMSAREAYDRWGIL